MDRWGHQSYSRLSPASARVTRFVPPGAGFAHRRLTAITCQARSAGVRSPAAPPKRILAARYAPIPMVRSLTPGRPARRATPTTTKPGASEADRVELLPRSRLRLPDRAELHEPVRRSCRNETTPSGFGCGSHQEGSGEPQSGSLPRRRGKRCTVAVFPCVQSNKMRDYRPSENRALNRCEINNNSGGASARGEIANLVSTVEPGFRSRRFKATD